MDDEKKWSGDEPQKDTAPPEATKPSVRYEENDNWEFEAQAPTLDDNFLADDQYEIQMPAEKPRPVESEPAAPAANSGEKQVTVRTAPLKITLFCLLFAAVVAVLAVLGVRYYTVPNGKEGEMLNPGGTALTVGETKVSLGAYNYYYSRIVQNYLNYANYGYYDLDSTKDYSKQYVTNSDGEKITWLQMFKDKTVDQIQYVTSYYEAGQAAGITLTADQKKSIKEQMDSLKSSASEANQSLDDYIEKEFGDYCTAATLENVSSRVPFYIAADSPAIQTLITTYNDVTGENKKPFTMGGGTYARHFPYAVSFGPEHTDIELPEFAGPMHGANEGTPFEKLIEALKIYILALLRLQEIEL